VFFCLAEHFESDFVRRVKLWGEGGGGGGENNVSLMLALYSPVVTTRICIASCGHYMYRQFNIQQFYVLPTQCIYVFCVDLRTNNDYFPIQH
jgi:hypothetical protein